MPAYVTLPGTSGNYFSTPDVNLLDADTAHLHQSIGTWTNQSGASTFVTASTMTPIIGDSHGQFKVVSTSQSFSRHSAVPISPSTQYTYSVYVATPETGVESSLSVVYDVGGFVDTGNVELTPNEWTLLSITDVSPSGASSVQLQIGPRVTLAVNDLFWWDAACIQAGADDTFVTSLRIVGDIEAEWKVALDDYTPTGHQTILDTQSSNDGYRIRHLTSDTIDIIHGNGSSPREETSSATGLTDGTAHVFKVTVDVSTGAVVYYIDGVQHDTDTMTTGAASPSGSDLYVGATNSDALHLDGDLYYVILRDGIDGPIIARFDADDWGGI